MRGVAGNNLRQHLVKFSKTGYIVDTMRRGFVSKTTLKNAAKSATPFSLRNQKHFLIFAAPFSTRQGHHQDNLIGRQRARFAAGVWLTLWGISNAGYQ